MPTVRATFDANIAPFRTSLAQATTAVTAFDRTVSQVNRDLARFGNQFSGATIMRQAETMAKAIKDIGGVTRLTDSELKRANSTIQEAITKYRLMGQQAPADVRRLAGELQNATASTRSFGDTLRSTFGNFTAGLGVGAGVSIFQTIGSSIRQMAEDGAKLSQLRRPFEALTGGAAQADAELRRMREATRGLVSDLELMQAANKAQLLGLTDLGLDLSDLADVATRLGRAMGQDAAKSVDDLTTALGRQSPMILDNLGITVRVSEANDKYAASLGKTASQLTDHEKKLAFVQAAMEAARAKATELGDITLTVSDQFARMGTTLSDAATRIGAFGNESGVLSGYLDVLNDGLDDVVEKAGRAVEEFADLVPSLGRVGEAFGDARGRSEAFATGLTGLVSPALFGLKVTLDSLTNTLRTYSALWDAARGNLGVDFTAPGRGDRQLMDTSFGANARARQWLDADIARRQKEYEEEQAKRLRAIARGMTGASEASKKLKAAEESRRKELERLEQVWQRMLRPSVGVNSGLGLTSIGGIAGAIAPGVGAVPGVPTGLPGIGINQFDPIFKQFGVAGGQAVDFAKGLDGVTRSTRQWRESLQSVSQAFSQLGQIAGGSLSAIARGMGTLFAGASAAVEATKAIGGLFQGLTTKDGGLSTGGRSLAGGLAGLTAGLQFGSLVTNRGAGFAAGAGAGAATGGMAAGWLGAGVGALVGGFAGMFAAAANAAARRRAKDLSASQLTAQFGGLDSLLDTVGRLGLNQRSFLDAYYGDPEDFAKEVGKLNAALEREKQIVDRLTKSLEAAGKAQGVLSKADMATFAGLRPGGPGDDVRRQFLSDQTGGLIAGITRMLQSGAVTPTGGAAAGQSLGAAFALLREQGVSTADAIRQLQPAIEAFEDAVVRAGKGSTAEFDSLKGLLDLLTSETLGPFVEAGLGAGQALAALANTGMLTQDMFAGLSTAIAEAYYALERDGQGGVEAVRLLQGPLQNIWQLMEDFGLQVDEDTRRLIDFAEEAGLIGDRFRPATDRMVAALDRLIERMDAFLSRLAEAASFRLPSVPDGGGGGGGGGGSPGPEVAMASGGLVTRPTHALIGEAGPEVVIPLHRLRGLGGGATTVVVPVSIDGREVTRVVARRLPAQARAYTGVA